MQCCEPITAWHKFCLLFLNIVKMGKEVEAWNCPNSSFSHNFCHWLSEKIQKNWNVVFYSWSFWITLKACNYPLLHYDISLNNFSSPNKHLKYLGKWGKSLFFRFFSGKTKLLASQKRFHKTCHCIWDCCITNINAQFV